MNKITNFTLNRIKSKYNKNEVYAITETANIPANKNLASQNFSVVGTIKYSRFFFWKKYEEKIENNDTVTLLDI